MAYKMTHPDSDAEIQVEAEGVPTYESQGWVTSKGAKRPDTPPATAAEAEADQQ